jgi:hypothetical protein
MNIVLSFIGKLPCYIVDCVHQIRSFSDSPIFIIINDLESPFVSQMLKYNVNIIQYNDVIDTNFIDTVNKNINKFEIVPGLGDRSQLFIRSFERFFLLHNLMKLKNLKNCFFMEVDNLIYDDPNIWLEEFSKKELCFMYDNIDRCSSGIMYVKQQLSLNHLLDYFTVFINTSHEFMGEMTCLYRYHELHKDEVQLLPIYWKSDTVSELAYKNDFYNNSIFDAAAIGVFLLGNDPYHTKGKIVTGNKNLWSAIDYTKEKFIWKKDERSRNKPYIWDGEKWLLINNLHVHSKALNTGFSLPL